MPQTITVPNKSGVVIGIDVGGAKKGFHVVALRDGHYLAKYAASDPALIAAWCQETGALIVGIDAPCRWSSTGRARSAERALAAERIFAFATPNIEKARSSPFYRWMLNGAELYRLIEPDYPLTKGIGTSAGRVCFETFPQAVACALAGKIVSAKRKAHERRELLGKAGIDISELSNIDTVDAALCALAAHYLLADSAKAYGDAKDGFIIIPAL